MHKVAMKMGKNVDGFPAALSPKYRVPGGGVGGILKGVSPVNGGLKG